MARTALDRLAYQIEETLRLHVKLETLTDVMFEYEDTDDENTRIVIVWGFRPGVNYKVTIQNIEVGNDKG